MLLSEPKSVPNLGPRGWQRLVLWDPKILISSSCWDETFLKKSEGRSITGDLAQPFQTGGWARQGALILKMSRL